MSARVFSCKTLRFALLSGALGFLATAPFASDSNARDITGDTVASTYGDITFSGTIGADLSLTITGVADTSAMGFRAAPHPAALSQGNTFGAADTIYSFGVVDDACSYATNGDCFIRTAACPGGAGNCAVYVATLTATLTFPNNIGIGSNTAGVAITDEGVNADKWPNGILYATCAADCVADWRTGGTAVPASGATAMAIAEVASPATQMHQVGVIVDNLDTPGTYNTAVTYRVIDNP